MVSGENRTKTFVRRLSFMKFQLFWARTAFFSISSIWRYVMISCVCVCVCVCLCVMHTPIRLSLPAHSLCVGASHVHRTPAPEERGGGGHHVCL